MDCFAALAMTARRDGLLRFARNDGRGNGLLRGASDEAIQAFDIGPRDISD
jgi:hypothetical protein